MIWRCSARSTPRCRDDVQSLEKDGLAVKLNSELEALKTQIHLFFQSMDVEVSINSAIGSPLLSNAWTNRWWRRSTPRLQAMPSLRQSAALGPVEESSNDEVTYIETLVSTVTSGPESEGRESEKC